MIRITLMLLCLPSLAFASGVTVSCKGEGEIITADLDSRMIVRNGKLFPFLRTDSFFGPIFKPYDSTDLTIRVGWSVRVIGRVTGQVTGTTDAEGSLDVVDGLDDINHALECTITGT
jgi:hypothetical protein